MIDVETQPAASVVLNNRGFAACPRTLYMPFLFSVQDIRLKELHHGKKYPSDDGGFVIGVLYDVDDDGAFDALPGTGTMVDCS